MISVLIVVESDPILLLSFVAEKKTKALSQEKRQAV